MSILIVDDSPAVLRLLQTTLERAGYADTVCADSGGAALRYLGIEPPAAGIPLDCILLDLVLPGINGIEVCRIIKSHPVYTDIPIIMITTRDEAETVRDAFMAGAHDYVIKPIREVELLARIKSAIALKQEIATRKAHAAELARLNEKLAEANAQLTKLTITDDLTRVGNRRYFSVSLDNEWRRAFRESAPLSVIFVEVDCFLEFREQYGQRKGDECLKLIAQVLQVSLRRTADHLARYSDSQFGIILPKTGLAGAQTVASLIRQSINELQVRHPKGFVSVSQGLAAVIPAGETAIQGLLAMAEEAVTSAQKEGGDRILCAKHENTPG